MSTAVFGDFLDRAEWHIQAAAGSLSMAADPGAAAQLLRLLTSMACCLDDCVPSYTDGVIATADLGPWPRAAADTGAALHQAADSLAHGMAAARIFGQQPAGELAAHLETAATSLRTGRDLMHTHLTTTPEDRWQDRSEWAPVVTSLPATRALTDTMARWSADMTGWLSLATGAELAELRDGLQAAARRLRAAGAAVQPARAIDPATPDDLRLLRAIPTAHNPPRKPPGPDEPVRELSLGITVSAQRMRGRAFGAMDRARWLAPSADTWQWAASAAAAAGHASELILCSLASQPSPPGDPLDSGLLPVAAEAMARSWKAFRHVAATWTGLSTETRGRTAPILTDISDLVIRIGRLAWNDPDWTPARPHTGPRRNWAQTAISNGPDAVAAVHQAADALARLTAADLDVVTAADTAGRLYVRTRTLPPGYDVPHPYATAPLDRTAPLLDAYRAAVHASYQAASVLASLALALDAPSAPLALARRAADPRHTQATATSQLPRTRVTPQHQPRIPAATPGPTERTIRSMRVTDPAILVRAAMIDNASRQLIAQAGHMARPTHEATDQQPLGHPAQLAAQDIPNTTATTAVQNGRVNRVRPAPPQPDTGQRPRPGSTRPGNGPKSARRRTG